MSENPVAIGNLLRTWRQRRRLSQLELALQAEISQRHLSFVESGRSAPSRNMVLHLADHLAVPLRQRNELLLAGGFAPVYQERALDDPDLAVARNAVKLILMGHEPHPALAIDRHWTLVSMNGAVAPLLVGIDPDLLEPPVNVLRLSLHPKGLAARIINFREWRAHILARLSHLIETSADRGLIELMEELKAYPVPPGARPYGSSTGNALAGIAIPLELRSDAGILSFLSTTTVFGTALDIALSELAIESFFPANAETAAVLRDLQRARRPG